ncbi:MAG: TnsA endonuclease N-terminal domain-containing protein [bacterium]
MASVRKIPVQTRSVAGYFYSFKNGRNIDFESQLEKKFYLLFEFTEEIESYQEQPVKVGAIVNGRKISYFPDCLVRFRPELSLKPLLIEIKYLKELKEKKEKIAAKARAVHAYSRENGYLFKIFTDARLDETYIDNIKFLYRYCHKPKTGRYDEYEGKILSALSDNGMSVNELLETVSVDSEEKAVVLPVLWHLIFNKMITADLYRPLTNSTIISLNREVSDNAFAAQGR